MNINQTCLLTLALIVSLWFPTACEVEAGWRPRDEQASDQGKVPCLDSSKCTEDLASYDNRKQVDVGETREPFSGSSKIQKYLHKFLAKSRSRRRQAGLISKYAAFLHDMETIAIQSRNSYIQLIEMSTNQSLNKISFCKSVNDVVNEQIIRKSENISISNHNLRTWERILAHYTGGNQQSTFSDAHRQRALKEVNILRAKIKSENKMIELLMVMICI